MKRNLFAIGLVFCMLLGLTACGGSKSENSAATAEVPMAAPMMEEMAMDSAEYSSMEMGGSGGTANHLDSQKMIYTAQLSLETYTFDEAIKALSDLTAACGGYFENSTIGERGSGYGWADYTIRVPAEQFQRFLDQAGELAHMTRCSTSQENVTEAYYDTQGRLETQKIKLERLQDLLRKAEKMEDIITLESAISEAEWQIESLSGTLRHYDALVDYATINVNLNEVYRYSNTDDAPLTFGQRMSSALSDGLKTFAQGLEDLAVTLAYCWMWLLILAVIVVVVVRVVRKQRRKRKEATAALNRENTENK